MNIIKYKYIFLSISGILILASVVSVFVFGLKPGIDFVGGALWQIKCQTLPADRQVSDVKCQMSSDSLKDFFENNLKEKNASVYSVEGESFLIRFNHISEDKHREYLRSLSDRFGEVEELSYETIGPTIGKELRDKAIKAVILVLLGISLYVIYAFRKSSAFIKSWKYGFIVLLTLFHDIIIPTGLLAFLGWKFGVELDTKFIVALLVIMGFSVHDTIVVFDRIRENLSTSRGKLDLSQTVNFSVKQTIARSINTSLTLIIALVALFFFGPASLKYFILIILVGTVIGTYSSIFIASPLLTFRGKFGN